MPAGKSIRIYLPDSSVSGVRYAELVNWTGQALACPRSRLADLAGWQEARKPGVYFLFEARTGDDRPAAYIGESEDVWTRLITHDKNKDYWNDVVLFTSKDENLTKSHIKYLEATLEQMARHTDRYVLQNRNTPLKSTLPRADQDAMKEFVQNMRMVLGTLGFPILEPLSHMLAGDAHGGKRLIEQELFFKIRHLCALGKVSDEGFILQQKSTISKELSASVPRSVLLLREQLIKDGVLLEMVEGYCLQQDILMSSSSYAAALVAGTSRSGPQSWRTGDGTTLGQLEDVSLAQAIKAIE